MRRVLCALMVTASLAACGPRAAGDAAKVAAAVAAPPVKAVQPAAVTLPDPFVGSWQVAGDEGPDKGDLKIAAAGDGYKVSYGVGSPGCGGQVDGTATRKGDVLHLIGKLKEAEGFCGLGITRQADGSLKVEEEDGRCQDFHGARCDFNGEAKLKSGPAKTAAN